MAGRKNNATSSWSGYNHQGQVGLFLALSKLKELINNDNTFKDFTVQFERTDGEDIDIICEDTVISRHQVKAKTRSKYPNDYKDVLTNFNTDGVNENARYLHTVCEVIGFNLPENEFYCEFHSKSGIKPIFIENESKVQLYIYPDGKEHCPLDSTGFSQIDNFCFNEIKDILTLENHPFKDDDIHIKGILLNIYELLWDKIRIAHKAGNNAHPVIKFSEIYQLIISKEKINTQSIYKAKKLINIYWQMCISDDDLAFLLSNMLNLPNEEFENLLIDLHPHKLIEEIKKNSMIESLLDEDSFIDIFGEFVNVVNINDFNLEYLQYTLRENIFRLSLINRKQGTIGEVVKSIQGNRQFLNATFEVDYLINGQIDSPVLPMYNNFQENGLASQYSNKPSEKDNIFSANLEFINIEKFKLKTKE
ncbi:hypothetical protein KFV08_11625 [Macrococcoides canis]|uniref:ABC-three component system protein n=1 Tax=Macrococcoides canis TaxID=1855823 RepID=UPI00207C7869|nr:ABC-three component system protein [Macrococcus canis]MCO4097334.1 hypothetical protein [Macrococcus canis]UTH09110.1 hypothetical protein KFV08_11625 [Macrococcus canis]